MTLAMQDSTDVAALLVGADAYGGYTDGRYKNVAAIRARFPGSRVIAITVTGADLSADCVDRETYDASPTTAAKWAKAKIAAGYWRPIIYVSQSVATDVLAALAATGVARSQIRLWTAHYGWPEHICSPTTCWLSDHSLLTFTADGTQWIDTGPNGENIDRSILADDFFATEPVQEDDMLVYWHEPVSGAIYAYSGDGLRHIGPLENKQALKLIADGHAVRYDVDAATIVEVLGAPVMSA